MEQANGRLIHADADAGSTHRTNPDKLNNKGAGADEQQPL
jgi:hypothetical protein